MSMKMRILQVTNYYAPAYSFGGPTRLLEIYANMLRSRNFRVDVLTSDLLTRETCQGSKILDLGDKGKIEYVHEPRWVYLTKKNIHLNFFLCLKIAVSIRKYDFVQLSEYRGLLPLVVIIFASLFNTKIVHHSFGMISQKRGVKKKIYDFIFRRLFLKRVSICFAENEEERLQYIEIGVDSYKIIVLPHPIMSDKSTDYVPRVPIEGKLDLCYVGRIHPNKGLGNCINLVYTLLNHFPNISLTVMGNDDGDLENIKRKIKELNLNEYIHFVRASYDETRFRLYRESDMFVILPDDNLQTSLAAIEALATGTPIINNLNCKIEEWSEFACTIDGKSDVEIVDRIKKLLLIDRNYIATHVRKAHTFDSVGKVLDRTFCSCI